MTRLARGLAMLLLGACSSGGNGSAEGTIDAGSDAALHDAGASGTGGSSAAGTGGGSGASGIGGDSGSGASAGTGGSAAGTGGAAGSATGSSLSSRYPGDVNIGSDSRVIFHSNFENGLTGWTRYSQNASRIGVLTDTALAHAGQGYLRAQVTRTELASQQYISANAQYDFATRVARIYWRFYARFVGDTAVPHHWVRVAAGDATFQSDGLANTVPPGDRGFWFDLDARRDQIFNFYVYWYEMRSGRCNDGSAVPGCAGDQGSTYYYGNNFTPAGQTPFARDQWFCLEIMANANTVGESDGELALWKDDALVGEYKPGTPRGRWLRDNFYSWGQYFLDEQAFEGFEFRSSNDVLFKRITLDAYYEKGSLDNLAMTTTVPEAQVILYDDVVVATERVGCMVD
jgi:hypothetical protein